MFSDSDSESGRCARSTLAEALAPPVHRITIYASDESDSAPLREQLPAEKGLASISIKSRELIRQSFTETIPICLPQGHPTIALTQEQTSE